MKIKFSEHSIVAIGSYVSHFRDEKGLEISNYNVFIFYKKLSQLFNISYFLN